MEIQKQSDEREGLLFCAMQSSQAAQSMLAWRWGREVFTRNARKAGKKEARQKQENRQEYCCMSVCESATK
jgi:hypothetical protein